MQKQINPEKQKKSLQDEPQPKNRFSEGDKSKNYGNAENPEDHSYQKKHPYSK